MIATAKISLENCGACWSCNPNKLLYLEAAVRFEQRRDPNENLIQGKEKLSQLFFDCQVVMAYEPLNSLTW